MSDQDKDEFLARYHDVIKMYDNLLREFKKETRPGWRIYLGKFTIPVRMNSGELSWLYVGTDIAIFSFGITCIFFQGSWRELGIALMVGSMFAMSTFIGQILSVQLDLEQHEHDLLWRDDLILKYAPRFAEIREQAQFIVDKINAQSPEHLTARNNIQNSTLSSEHPEFPRGSGLGWPDATHQAQ